MTTDNTDNNGTPEQPKAGMDEIDLPHQEPQTPAAPDTAAPVESTAPAEPAAEATGQASAPANPDEHAETEAAIILPPYEDSKTVQQDHLTFLPLGEKETWDDLEVAIPLPADTDERITDFIKGLPNEQVDETRDGAEWSGSLLQGRTFAPRKDQFNDSVEREGSTWRQQAQHGAANLSAARPRIAESDGPLVAGAKAVLKVRALMGLGTLVQIPLWHSGFWITLKSPSDGSLLELFRRISDDKVELGRRTSGWVFANSSVYFAEHVLNYAMEHLWGTTLKDVDQAAAIRPLIQTQDIQTIAWGLACVLWPKGFGYSRSVLTPTGVDKPVIKERLNVAKLQWVDTASLTKWQTGHMAKRAGNTMTARDLEQYKSEFTVSQPREVDLTEDKQLRMTLRVPNLDEYINAGHKWVTGVVTMVDQAFRNPPDDATRDAYITNQSKASIMRQYAHWVESIHAGDRQIVDRDSIDMVLDNMSESPTVRVKFFEEVHSFIDDSTVSVIATPAVSTTETNILPRFPHLVPLDAMYTFFILLMQKSQLLINRE